LAEEDIAEMVVKTAPGMCAEGLAAAEA